MSGIVCCYPGGCDREGIRLFDAPPVEGWLCEEHFEKTLNAAAELEAVARRKDESEWLLYLEKYLREHNLTKREITQAHVTAALNSWRKARQTPGTGGGSAGDNS